MSPFCDKEDFVSIEQQLSPDREAGRLAAVRRYEILDTPPDGAFDRITSLAAKHFEVPISIVSIVDTDRIWFKSHHGLEVEEIGRDPGLCASAILGDETWVVENAATDPRTMANPLVAGEMGLGFYAGAPLVTRDGHSLGTLCVIDQQPREFPQQDVEMLAELAGVVMDELELRLSARATVGQELVLREQAEQMARALQSTLLPPELPEIAGADLAALYLPADAGVVGGDFYDVFMAGQHCVLAVGDVSGKGAEAAAVTGLARHTIRSAALWATGPADILTNLNQAMLLGGTGAEIDHFCTVLLIFAARTETGFALTIATAGHPPALLVGTDGGVTERATPGPPAGWYDGARFPEVTADLRPGERLVMFTDGLTEARTPDGFFGFDGLKQCLTTAGDSAVETVDALRRAVSAEGVEVRDDVAALVLGI